MIEESLFIFPLSPRILWRFRAIPHAFCYTRTRGKLAADSIDFRVRDDQVVSFRSQCQIISYFFLWTVPALIGFCEQKIVSRDYWKTFFSSISCKIAGFFQLAYKNVRSRPSETLYFAQARDVSKRDKVQIHGKRCSPSLFSLRTSAY